VEASSTRSPAPTLADVDANDAATAMVALHRSSVPALAAVALPQTKSLLSPSSSSTIAHMQIPSHHTRARRRLQPRKVEKTAWVRKKTRPVGRWIEGLHRTVLLRGGYVSERRKGRRR